MSSIWVVTATGCAQDLDREEALRGIRVLCDSAHGVELRAPPSWRSVHGRGDDPEGLLGLAESLAREGASAIYLLLNPVRLELRRPARIPDILSRRWLLIDVDPVRPSTDVMATDEECAAARETTARIIDHLTGLGWPAPILLDSGNGLHVLYRIDLPNDDQTRNLYRRLLRRLDQQFTEKKRTEVDTKVHHADVRTKLPGSWVRKGQDTPERPHRLARLIHVPAAIQCVPVELIAQAAGVEEKEVPQRSPFVLMAVSDGTEAYGRKALDQECARVAAAPLRVRNNTLFMAAASLGQLVGGGVLQQGEVEQELTAAARACGLDRDGNGERGVAATIKSGLFRGMKEPRGVPEKNGRSRSNGKTPAAPKPQYDPSESIVVRADTITPRPVEWLWPGRLPLGKLTTFAGPTSVGKTFVLLDIAARVTRGLDWPDSRGECQEPGRVLFITGEDDYDDTLVPRLIELDADLTRVSFLRTEVQDRFTLDDLDTLRLAAEQAGPDLRYVAIDPPTAFLGGVDDNSNSELRGLLSPLKSFAAQMRLALAFITHVNKAQGKEMDALMRVMGSVAWVNAVRAAHMLVKDQGDPERRLFLPLKCNVGPTQKGLAYRIVQKGALARVEWQGEVDTTADQAVRQGRKETREVAAAEWLVERFRERRSWTSEELFQAAHEEGVSRKAVFEAKKVLDLPRCKKHTDQEGNVCWLWWVPDNWPPLAAAGEEGQVKNTGTLGTLEQNPFL